MNAPKWKPGSLKIAASLAALVAVCVGLIVSMLHIPQAVAATRAALVELIAPSRPFFGSANGSANYSTIGPASAEVLAVSSITLQARAGRRRDLRQQRGCGRLVTTLLRHRATGTNRASDLPGPHRLLGGVRAVVRGFRRSAER